MNKSFNKFGIYIAFFLTIFGFNNLTLYAKTVLIGGDTIGISMKNQGLTVSGTYDIIINGKTYNPKKHGDIKEGDIIIAASGQKTETIQDFLKILMKINTNKVSLKLIRNSNTISRDLAVSISSDGTFKTGIYVKERLLGIGTLTFYDPETKMYGALGHEIIDCDTKKLYDVKSGTIFESEVTGINKSQDGIPGEKIAKLEENHIIGTIVNNSIYGIYGKYEGNVKAVEYETARQDQIKKGPAQLLTVLDKDKIEAFDINITELQKQDSIATKGITFEVVDEDLLNITNGIVQGMSGSPIIQDGLLIGAVTHVLVNDVTSGHGIYIEWMLQHASSVEKVGS